MEVKSRDLQPLSDQVEDLKAKMEVKNKEEQSLTNQVEDLKAKLEVKTREEQSLSDQVEDLKAKLESQTSDKLDQPQDTHKDELGRLQHTNRQQLKQALWCNTAREALHKELWGLKKENFIINQELKKEKDMCQLLRGEVARLENETKSFTSLSKEKESLAIELQSERSRRLYLSDERQKYHDTLLQAFRAVKSTTETTARKTESLAIEQHQLNDQGDITASLETEIVGLSNRLQTDSENSSLQGVIDDGEEEEEGKRRKRGRPRKRKKPILGL